MGNEYVRLRVILALDNVNFTSDRPVTIIVQGPESRPGTTSGGRHAAKVGNKETAIPGVLACQTNAGSAFVRCGIVDIGAIDSQADDIVIIDRDETLGEGSVSVLIAVVSLLANSPRYLFVPSLLT